MKKTESNVNVAIVKVSNLVDKFNEDRKEKREDRKKGRQAKKDPIKQSKLIKKN